MSNNLPEIQKLNTLLDITYNNLLDKFPKTSSRNYKSNLRRFIKNTMEYDLQITKESLVELLKIIETKRINIKNVVDIYNFDYKNVKLDYAKIKNTYSEFVKQKYESNLESGAEQSLAIAMTQFDINSTASRNCLSARLIRSSESAIKNKLCTVVMEIKKNEMTLKLLKKIRYHLHYSLSKYC